ncbi:hypothetical protein ACFSHP_12615 [Novosphingobium panipatense]
MGAAADKLMALVADPERFTFSAHELRETQVAALDERFQERRAQIKLLGLRARDAGWSASPELRMWCRCCFRTPRTNPIRKAT